MFAFNLVGLTPVHRNEARPVFPQPRHGRTGLVDQDTGKFFVRLVVGDLHQRVVEKLSVVSRQLDLGPLIIGQVRHHILTDIVQPGVAKTKAASGEVAIAAFFLLRRFFEHEHTRALQVRIDCST